jgi:transcriptional regulator with XRE-family HTH domain
MEKQDMYREAFRVNLKTLMYENTVTQQELADAVGLKRQTIALYESGDASPRLEGFAAIAKYFNVSCDYLLGISKTPSFDPSIQTVVKMYGLVEESLETLYFIVDDPQGEEDQRALHALNVILSNYGFFVPFFDLIFDNLYLEPDDEKIKFKVSVSERGKDSVRDEEIFSRSLDAKMYKELQIVTLYRFIEALRQKLSDDNNIETIERPTFCNASIEAHLNKLNNKINADRKVVQFLETHLNELNDDINADCNVVKFLETHLNELNDDINENCDAARFLEAIMNKYNDDTKSTKKPPIK